ncbi:MAG: alpha/beta fold hydrolase [Chitinophagaceae bacterium]|nr:alpha/beta fold hydrolase [Chitinophagaceae bacterium]
MQLVFFYAKRFLQLIPAFLILMFASFAVQGQQKQTTYILVHGAWHGAWCWNKVVPLMEAKGDKVLAIDLPGHGKDTTNPDNITFNDYVHKVVSVVNSNDGEVILVGHSMAGTVISQAAELLGTKKVSKLVYLDAFLPKNGESVRSLAGMIDASLPKDSTRISIGKGLIISSNKKTSIFKPEIADILFYHDCSAEDRAFAHKNLSPQNFEPNGTPVSVSDNVYGAIPKYYILCTESKDLDKSVLPSRVKCKKIIKIKSSHSPFFSMPEKLARILHKI